MLVATVFAVFVAALLWYDLHSHKDVEIPLASATKWSIFYVGCALAFAGFLAVDRGGDFASLFLTAYVLEQALSVDNLMVFTAVFAYFGVPSRLQHRVLYWGILGAIVFRLAFVLIGASALEYIGKPVEFVFALLVGWAAWKVLMMDSGEPEEVDHRNRWYVRWVSKIWPVSPKLRDNRFFYTFEEGYVDGPPEVITQVTPLFLCLVSIEVMDLMFAVDSVPVVIAVARDPLIIYSAMIFAIMGLRSMYFVLSALQRVLVHLGKAVGVVLMFVTGKLLAGLFDVHVDPFHSLFVVLGILAAGVGASLIWRPSPHGPSTGP